MNSNRFVARTKYIVVFAFATCLAMIAPVILGTNSILFVHQPEPPEELLK